MPTLPCVGGPLDGRERSGLGAFLKLPQYEGRELIGWDDGVPIYSWPEHLYRRSRGTWHYVGLIDASKRLIVP